MKALATTLAALLVTLAGCNQLGGSAGNASNSSSNASAGNASAAKESGAGNEVAATDSGAPGGKDSTGASQASSGAVTLDRAFLLGSWADNGDCSKAIAFAQDGSFRNADGSAGLWNLEGNQLTLTGSSTASVRISPIDQNTITVINPDGSLGRSTRC